MQTRYNREMLAESTSQTDFEVSDPPKINPRQISFASSLIYLFLGIAFGFVFVKGEVVSWLRIQEMFRFQSFHMYGVIGSAVVVAALSVFIIKRTKMKALNGEPIDFQTKKFQKGQIIGGLTFGFGWAMTGACPGPLFAQVGMGFTVVLVVIISAIAGTWMYGFLREKLPH